MIKELPESDEVVSAAEVLIAAFALKKRALAPLVTADFVGLQVPDRFVFGFGMDLAGAWRNLPAIHALKEAAS